MRIKLDENLPRSLAPLLNTLGHDVHHVEEEGLLGSPDPAVAAAAKVESRLLFTMDIEFADLRKYPPGSHPGVVLFRSAAPGAPAIIGLVSSFVATTSEAEIVGAVVVVEFGRVRIRRAADLD